MNLMDKIYKKAKEKPLRVAFPETEEEKILLAAAECEQKGYCIPVLVGKKEEVLEHAAGFGINISDMEIADSSDEAWLDGVIAEYVKINSIFSAKSMKRKSKDAMNVALMLQALGMVDVTFAGMAHTTGDVVLGAQTFIGMQEGITTPSSIGIGDFPDYTTSEGNLLIFGDSAVCQNPSSEDLASIAISTCETAKNLLGWEPRCALLSFSTDGSAQGELVDKVLEAKRIANEQRPDLKIDGEFQFDAAVVPETAAKKVKRASEVAGKANIVIWPDLNVGNIGVKLMQQFGKADAYGPCLQGFKKIVCDCSRNAPVSEIVGNVAISVVRAQAYL
ncbi:Ethanolamine utilization protein eutD [uncultured Roseburia sp.]|uniref:Phosphate acyltransferase n=1 Tax=Brotonthovivens ammoniilytica TaxID=2981725 RepID=A0ABT2TF92_9FIRM|nr:phosphate acyltransferase [Brotonthovivens ammoniilytica]MCU6760849.1 phosphate acyltransferase [Brotonthovivens ammoniilytica]SCI11142.1 Ethanolamine utilization protein eutD [uncultured Roseburia sp.]